MTDACYERSVAKALAAHGGLRDFVQHFVDLPGKVAGMYAYDVVALTGANVQALYDKNETVLLAHTLSMRGYDYNTSHAIYSKLLYDFPEFTPERVMLSSRDMLIDEFGQITGGLLATTLVEPKEQPILHAMLFAPMRSADMVVVERECHSTLFAAKFASITNMKRMTYKSRRSEMTPWQLRDASALLPADAEAHFFNATDGERLQRIVPVYVTPERLLCDK